jgi:glutamyl-tRNA synthetase
MKKKIRVRFAPSPTGFMHVGNVRAALLNYLFAHQKKGDFVLRIEDTDKARNLDEAGAEILQDLTWLGLKHTEGPIMGGSHGPYVQSDRTKIYQKHLNDLIENKQVYRCFCSRERLEKLRKEQLDAGRPPRYDRACWDMSDDQIKQNIAEGKSFIWRFALNQDECFEIKDMARGMVKFDMKHFSDFALTRADGSFTFLFTNFVDDWLMEITHVIRGEDHLTNTAMQAAMFRALAVDLPTFWHLPMLCSKTDGKKLSKRDFGFSLHDLRKDGFLPQAICNYLAIIGSSFEHEIQSLGELTKNFDFEHIHATGAIKFDVEKLLWINHKWIERLSLEHLAEYVKPFLIHTIPQSKNLSDDTLHFMLDKLRSDIKTLQDVSNVFDFYFNEPEADVKEIEAQIGKQKCETILEIITQNIEHSDKTELFLDTVKAQGKERGLQMKEVFGPIRYLLTGSFRGPRLHDLFEILADSVIYKRLQRIS